MTRYLWLIRHAKSDWGHPGLKDFDRPLNDRGNRNGTTMAAFLSRQSHPATWIWHSPARRAAQTADIVAGAFGVDAARQVPEVALYHADPDTLLEIIARTPDDVGSVALVAHNPGLTYLCQQLGVHPPLDNLPTFGVVRYRCAGSWHSLRPASTTFDGFAAPRALTDFP